MAELRTIVEVNDALGVIERPTHVEAACASVAAIRRYGRVTPYQPSHYPLVFNRPVRGTAPHPLKSRIPIHLWWHPQLEVDISESVVSLIVPATRQNETLMVI